MLYDWYTQDCTTLTEKQSCVSGETVETVVANDLSKLSQSGFNFIHLYLWDQDSLEYPVLATSSPGPGFVGWDNGGPAASPANPLGPNDLFHNQWTALQAFANLAKTYNIGLMLEFDAQRPVEEINLGSCGHMDCNNQSLPNSTCPAGYPCTTFTHASIGCSYASWVNSFVNSLEQYQSVLVWGHGYSLPYSSSDDFWQASCNSSGGAYQQITTQLLQNPYTNPAGRPLFAIAVKYSTATGPSSSGFSPYPVDWADAQLAAYGWLHLSNSQMPPDFYTFQLGTPVRAISERRWSAWQGHPDREIPYVPPFRRANIPTAPSRLRK